MRELPDDSKPWTGAPPLSSWQHLWSSQLRRIKYVAESSRSFDGSTPKHSVGADPEAGDRPRRTV